MPHTDIETTLVGLVRCLDERHLDVAHRHRDDARGGS
jgi:hypothetical protein